MINYKKFIKKKGKRIMRYKLFGIYLNIKREPNEKEKKN